jgi:hypothetical protein
MDSTQVEKMRRTEQVLRDARVVAAGTLKLKDIYGSSYFGSGGGYGRVDAYDLAGWRAGKRIKKSIATEDRDNGFVSGPAFATIEPNTVLICKGGDNIGDEGRYQEEIYICE